MYVVSLLRYTCKEIFLGREFNKNIKSLNDRPPLFLPTGKKVIVLVPSGILTLFFFPPPGAEVWQLFLSRWATLFIKSKTAASQEE